MPALWLIALAGLVVGLLYGSLGVGGAVVGTPLLALMGVPALMAVGSPLPATLPAALVAAAAYRRRREIDISAIVPAAVAAVPGAIAGALLSGVVGGRTLLVLSGFLLAVAGIELLRPAAVLLAAGASRSFGTTGPALTPPTARRRAVRIALCALAASFLSGLLANGGAALLVPLFILAVGMDYRTAAGTSLLIVPLIALPAVVIHAALGHIDWAVAVAFGAGAVPAAALGAALSGHFSPRMLQRCLGWLLVAFAVAFVVRILL